MSQGKLVDDLLTLQDKKIHALFANYMEHRDEDKLFNDIRILLNFTPKEDANLIKPIKAPSNSVSPETPSLQTPKDHISQMETPAFDKNKNKRMENIKDEINLSSIKITPVAQEDPAPAADRVPTFNEALLTFVLKKEGVSEKFVAKLLDCLDACNRDEPEAADHLISEFIDYGKSRLVNILKDDFSYKETSYILKQPTHFKESFEKANRLRVDPKALLKSNLKEALKSLNEIDDLRDEGDEDLEIESPVNCYD